MNFYTRKWIKPEDLNAHNTLFGGRLLSWIDEEAAIYAMCQIGQKNLVTKFISEINFVSSASHGDVIEIGFDVVAFGTSSITMKCLARNKNTKQTILSIEKVVFVYLDQSGKPIPHGKTMPEEI